MTRRYIRKLPAAQSRNSNPHQGVLDLRVDCQKEIEGIGMGVLNDGTAFLTQRGLARMCGVQNAHIGTMGFEWDEPIQKPRISKIKDLLRQRGVELEKPYIETTDGYRTIYAYPEAFCVAVLEYYAFEAGQFLKERAKSNFRLLAGRQFRDFVYSHVGYDPSAAAANRWAKFHDRVSLTYDSVPDGYFGIFKEIADMNVTLGEAGLHLDENFVPDISVGRAWSQHWEANRLSDHYGERRTYQHNYPEYFPQAKSNPQDPWCYPEAALGEFRRWFREHYVHGGQFARYVRGKAANKSLPPEFAEGAIEAYERRFPRIAGKSRRT